MALGAFWPEDDDSTEAQLRCLNAPYGARCFLTSVGRLNTPASDPCLNAPYGARCLTKYVMKGYVQATVS